MDNKLRVYVDFNNADAQGNLRLNCIGTIEDLSVQKIILEKGKKLTFSDEELEVDGIVEYSELEKGWVAVIDWDRIRQIEMVGNAQEDDRGLSEDILGKFEQLLDELEKADNDQKKVTLRREIDILEKQIRELMEKDKDRLAKHKEIGEAELEQMFEKLFGKDKNEKMWSDSGWDSELVSYYFLRAVLEENDPEISQRLQERGINLQEIIDKINKNI